MAKLGRKIQIFFLLKLDGFDMDVRQQLADRLRFDYPSEEQLNSINKWKPRGQADYDRREVLSVPILASTSMLRRDMTIWTKDTLRSMTATYPGESLMLNHDWFDVSQSIGFIYDAEFLEIPAGGGAIESVLANLSINSDIDIEVYRKQGFASVICYAAIPADSPAAGAIRYRKLADVSTGGSMLKAKYICPLCGGDFGEDDDHYPPGRYSEFLADIGEIDRDLIAPFAWVDGWHDSFELSFVTVGNVPQASIFVDDLINLIWS